MGAVWETTATHLTASTTLNRGFFKFVEMLNSSNVNETSVILKEYAKVISGLNDINESCKAFENLTEDEDFKAVFENISTALTASVEQANGVVKDKFAELFARR